MLLLVLVVVAPLTAANSTKPVLIMKHQMCSDLCTSGLGGAACGELCSDEVVLELRSRLRQYTPAPSQLKRMYGPRRAVCPLLCRSNLGDPLCGCHVNRWEALSGLRSQWSDWLWASFLARTSQTYFGHTPPPTFSLLTKGHHIIFPQRNIPRNTSDLYLYRQPKLRMRGGVALLLHMFSWAGS